MKNTLIIGALVAALVLMIIPSASAADLSWNARRVARYGGGDSTRTGIERCGANYDGGALHWSASGSVYLNNYGSVISTILGTYSIGPGADQYRNIVCVDDTVTIGSNPTGEFWPRGGSLSTPPITMVDYPKRLNLACRGDRSWRRNWYRFGGSGAIISAACVRQPPVYTPSPGVSEISTGTYQFDQEGRFWIHMARAFDCNLDAGYNSRYISERRFTNPYSGATYTQVNKAAGYFFVAVEPGTEFVTAQANVHLPSTDTLIPPSPAPAIVQQGESFDVYFTITNNFARASVKLTNGALTGTSGLTCTWDMTYGMFVANPPHWLHGTAVGGWGLSKNQYRLQCTVPADTASGTTFDMEFSFDVLPNACGDDNSYTIIVPPITVGETCEDSATCTGACPTGEACQSDNGGCECVPTDECVDDDNPLFCDPTECPSDLVCNDDCECIAPPSCESSPGICDATACPDYLECNTDCECVTPECETAPGVCDETACPTDLICNDDCLCIQPPECEDESNPGTCLPDDCPTDLICNDDCLCVPPLECVDDDDPNYCDPTECPADLVCDDNCECIEPPLCEDESNPGTCAPDDCPTYLECDDTCVCVTPECEDESNPGTCLPDACPGDLICNDDCLCIPPLECEDEDNPGTCLPDDCPTGYSCNDDCECVEAVCELNDSNINWADGETCDTDADCDSLDGAYDYYCSPDSCNCVINCTDTSDACDPNLCPGYPANTDTQCLDDGLACFCDIPCVDDADASVCDPDECPTDLVCNQDCLCVPPICDTIPDPDACFTGACPDDPDGTPRICDIDPITGDCGCLIDCETLNTTCSLGGCPNPYEICGYNTSSENCECVPGNETICDDQIDNDGDGLVDCFDPDCCGDVACPSTLTDEAGYGGICCYNLEDEDGDGDVDFADADCSSTSCPTSEPTCGGHCPPNNHCEDRGDGSCACFGGPPPGEDCISGDTPACSATDCPDYSTCAYDSVRDVCFCDPGPGSDCADGPAPACIASDCPPQNPLCLYDGETGDCGCYDIDGNITSNQSDLNCQTFMVIFDELSNVPDEFVEWTFEEVSRSGVCLEVTYKVGLNTALLIANLNESQIANIATGQQNVHLLNVTICTADDSYCTVVINGTADDGVYTLGIFTVDVFDISPLCPSCQVLEVPSIIHPIGIYSTSPIDAVNAFAVADDMFSSLSCGGNSACSALRQQALTNKAAAERYLDACTEGNTDDITCRMSQYYSSRTIDLVVDAFATL